MMGQFKGLGLGIRVEEYESLRYLDMVAAERALRLERITPSRYSRIKFSGMNSIPGKIASTALSCVIDDTGKRTNYIKILNAIHAQDPITATHRQKKDRASLAKIKQCEEDYLKVSSETTVKLMITLAPKESSLYSPILQQKVLFDTLDGVLTEKIEYLRRKLIKEQLGESTYFRLPDLTVSINKGWYYHAHNLLILRVPEGVSVDVIVSEFKKSLQKNFRKKVKALGLPFSEKLLDIRSAPKDPKYVVKNARDAQSAFRKVMRLHAEGNLETESLSYLELLVVLAKFPELSERSVRLFEDYLIFREDVRKKATRISSENVDDIVPVTDHLSKSTDESIVSGTETAEVASDSVKDVSATNSNKSAKATILKDFDVTNAEWGKAHLALSSSQTPDLNDSYSQKDQMADSILPKCLPDRVVEHSVSIVDLSKWVISSRIRTSTLTKVDGVYGLLNAHRAVRRKIENLRSDQKLESKIYCTGKPAPGIPSIWGYRLKNCCADGRGFDFHRHFANWGYREKIKVKTYSNFGAIDELASEIQIPTCMLSA